VGNINVAISSVNIHKWVPKVIKNWTLMIIGVAHAKGCMFARYDFLLVFYVE